MTPTRTITKNGYIYIYVSNESAQKVFFDNLTIHHNRGPILQEDHYYPFGLTMAGISDQAMLKPENRFKFNGKELNHHEFSDNSGLDWYSYGMREYDPQIGRFFRIDPLAEKFNYLTPYQYSSNDPIRNIDLDGLEGVPFQDVLNWSAEQIGKDPNSGASKAIGVVVGVGASVQNTVGGVGNAIAHPISTLQSLALTPEGIAAGSANMAAGISSKISAYQNGTGFVKAAIISQAVSDVGTAVVGTKGLGTALKGTEAARAVVETEGSAEATTTPSIRPSTDFVVTKNGEAIPIPDAASGPTNPQRGTGMVYQGGSGGKGMNTRTTGVRIMDENANQGSRVNYMNKNGQTVDPTSGRTIPNSDSRGHLPLQQ